MMQYPLKLKAKPNSMKTEILRENGNEIALAVKSPVENNKANLEIIKFFSKVLKTKVKIIRGLKSRNKLLTNLE